MGGVDGIENPLFDTEFILLRKSKWMRTYSVGKCSQKKE